MKILILVFATIFFAGCSTTAPHKFVAEPEKKWEQRKSEISKINDWSFNGRVSIINGHESWLLNMQWQFHSGEYRLDLSGPFGAGHAQLRGSDDGVILTDSDQNNFYASNPDRLLHEITGVRMPVQSLLYWMRGIPNRNIKKQQEKIDAFGRLQKIKQDGWNVHIKQYTQVAGTATEKQIHELPEKIFIDGHGLNVKVFVEDWDLKTKLFAKK